MGIARPYESEQVEIEELRRTLLLHAATHARKVEEDFHDRPLPAGAGDDYAEEDKLVCVTSGVSYLGLAIVHQLLLRGYSVRIIVTNEEDLEKLREMELVGEMSSRVSAVMAEIGDVRNLTEAFDGCRGVFHTASFVDPGGLSGYSKSMADIEARTSENVMEACARTASVRKCIFTSSLLACVWRSNSHDELPSVVNHECWSDESVCIDKKLWYALGKLRAEKAAWRIAEQKDFKLVTICPGLITGPEFSHRNPTATIAYLKGAKEMYKSGLLATVDVNGLAEAHVRVFEAMNKTASGRYICFDSKVESDDQVEELTRKVGMDRNTISGNVSSFSTVPFRFELSNAKLCKLLSRTARCTDEHY